MKLRTAALLCGFLLAGSLPWFTLGPASTLGIMGWSAGLFSVLASVCGVSAAVLSALADKGMPAKAGSAGPRLGALAAALASLTFVIVWLSTSSNTQAGIGNDTLLLHYGPGATATAILSLAAVAVTAHQLVTSQEPVPPSLELGARSFVRKFSNTTTSSGVPNSSATRRGPAAAGKPSRGASPLEASDRPTNSDVGPHGPRSQARVHLPQGTGMPPPEESPAGETGRGGPGVQESENDLGDSPEQHPAPGGER